MAKKKTTQLANLQLDGTLDISDVISVVTSRAETKLHQELAGAKARLKFAEKELTDLQQNVTDKQKKETQAAAVRLAKKLRPAIEEGGGTVVIAKFHERACHDDDGKLKREVRIQVGGYGSLGLAAITEPSAALVKLEASVKEAETVVKQRRDEALVSRQKLAGLPVLERRARAKLAETKLAESDDGQRVLELLTADLENEILGIPTN